MMWHSEEACLNHLVCPRRLPSGEDMVLKKAPLAPIQSLLEFLATSPYKPSPSLVIALRNALRAQPGEQVDKKKAQELLQGGEPVVLYLPANNVMLQIVPASSAAAEEMEVSAFTCQVPAATVIAKTSVQRCFPDIVCHSTTTWTGSAEFARQVLHLCTFTPPDAAATAKKAGRTFEEIRDVPNPRYVVEWLVPVLGAASQTERGADPSLPAEFEQVTKKVIDEVSWDKSKVPWRRSPVWMAVKAMLHWDCYMSCRRDGMDQREALAAGTASYKIMMLEYFCFVWSNSDLQQKILMSNHDLGHQFLVKLSRRHEKVARQLSDVIGASNSDWQRRLARCEATVCSGHQALDKAWQEIATRSIDCLPPPEALQRPWTADDNEIGPAVHSYMLKVSQPTLTGEKWFALLLRHQ